MKSLIHLRGIDPGFRPDHVLSVRLVLSQKRYGDASKRARFFERVLEHVRSLGGVHSAGVTSALPLSWKGGTSAIILEGVPMNPNMDYDANNRVITPGYFETMKIPLEQGRLLNDGDGQNAPLVALINRTMARKFWANQNPIGKRFRRTKAGDPNTWIRVVGVVGDVRQMNLNEAPRQEMYFPYFQAADNWMVPQRTREIGIRVALGAIRTDIFRTVAGQGLGLTALGIAIGLVASLALTRLLASLLFQITGTDPATYISAAALFMAVALLACLVPAHRAARVDPMVALRNE
jgi:hypothetical protein